VLWEDADLSRDARGGHVHNLGIKPKSWWVLRRAESYRSALCSGRHPLRFGPSFIDRADHVEGLLRQVVVLPSHQFFESADRVFELHINARRTSECLSDVEWLRKEALNFFGLSIPSACPLPTARPCPRSR